MIVLRYTEYPLENNLKEHECGPCYESIPMEDFICSVCEVVYDHEPEFDDFVIETSPFFDTDNQCPECGLTVNLTIITPPTIDSTIIN